MKKCLLIVMIFGFLIPGYSQQDTLTVKETEVLKLFGGIIKNVANEALKENSIGSGKNGLVGGAIRKVLTETAGKSIRQLGVPGGFKNDPRSKIQLPAQLKSLEENFQQFGKKQLLDNLVSSMNEAASNALSGLAPLIAGKFVDMAVDRIMANAGSPDSTLAEAFDHMFRSDLKTDLIPLVEKGLKVYKTTRTIRKINKLVKRKNLGSLELNLNDHIASGTVDGLINRMKEEEMNIRQNPAGLIDKLIELIKQ